MVFSTIVLQSGFGVYTKQNRISERTLDQPRSRATSGRGLLFPLGDTTRKFVADGNLLGSRVTLMLWICSARGLIWLVEQPEGSVFPLHPRWQEFIRYCPVPSKRHE